MSMNRLWLAAVLTLALSAPAYAGQSARPVAYPDSASWSAQADELVLRAIAMMGIDYRRGGSSPERGFDCSGFVRHVFGDALGIALPHNAAAQSHAGEAIAARDLRPGDLVFFNTLRRAFSHVGIYLGDDRFIHAPRTGQAIKIAQLSDPYWARRYNGARRVFKAGAG